MARDGDNEPTYGINESHDSTWTVGSSHWRWHTLNMSAGAPSGRGGRGGVVMAKFPSTAEPYSRGGTKNHHFLMDYANEL